VTKVGFDRGKRFENPAAVDESELHVGVSVDGWSVLHERVALGVVAGHSRLLMKRTSWTDGSLLQVLHRVRLPTPQRGPRQRSEASGELGPRSPRNVVVLPLNSSSSAHGIEGS
jgi:hypothetical protein